MEKRKNILYILTTFLLITNIVSLQPQNVGVYEEEVETKKIQRKTITPTPDIMSFGCIIRLKNESNETYIGFENRKMGGKQDPTIDTYWYVYPENLEDKNIKNKHAIKNGSTVKIINVANGKELGGHSWILEAKGSIENYIKKDNRFTLKDPDNETYLSGSLDILGETDLYQLNTRKTLSQNAYWTITNYYPAYLENEFKKGDVVAIKSLLNDKYLTFMRKIDVTSKRTNQPSDQIIFNQIVSPLLNDASKTESRFEIDRKGGSLEFKSLGKAAKGYYIRSNATTDKGFDKTFLQGQKEYNYSKGLFQIWSNKIGNLEKFRLDGFYIKSSYSKGYVTYLYTIKQYLEALGDRNRSVYKNESPFIKTPILSSYDNVYFKEGSPNKRTPKALFTLIKLSGDPIMPIIPEEETTNYGDIVEAAEIKLKKSFKGKFQNWKEIAQPGIADFIFEAKAIDNITIGLASESKDYKKGEKIYEVIIGGGVGKEANTYSLIRNTHMGKASDAKIGTFKMGKNIPNKNWNSYWVRVIDQKISFGNGKIPGENLILEWTDPSEEGILVKYIGISNYKNPVYFKNLEYATPDVEEEIKAEFFSDKLKGARSIKIFKDQINKYISLIPEATESEIKTKGFFNEIIWLSQNTPKGKETEFQKLIENIRWNTKLISPTTESIVNYFAVKSGSPMKFSKKIDAIEGLINQAYSDETIKTFLINNRDDIVTQLKILAEESIDSSPENKKRVQSIIETFIYDPTFTEYATILEAIAKELTKEATIESLLERVASGSATADEPTEIRFMKIATKLITNEISTLMEEEKQGTLSKESVQKAMNLEKLLKSIKYGLEFESNHKQIANDELKKIANIKVTSIKIQAPIEGATEKEKVDYLIAATRDDILKSTENKKVFFETIGELVKNKNLAPDLIEKIRNVLGIIKWHPDINDQEDALVKYYESQISIPVTIDDKVNELLKSVLTIKDEASEKIFLKKIDTVIHTAEKSITENKKAEGMDKLKNLLLTMKNLPTFEDNKDEINTKLKEVDDLTKKNETLEKEVTTEIIETKTTTQPTTETVYQVERQKTYPIRRRTIPTQASTATTVTPTKQTTQTTPSTNQSTETSQTSTTEMPMQQDTVQESTSPQKQSTSIATTSKQQTTSTQQKTTRIQRRPLVKTRGNQTVPVRPKVNSTVVS